MRAMLTAENKIVTRGLFLILICMCLAGCQCHRAACPTCMPRQQFHAAIEMEAQRLAKIYEARLSEELGVKQPVTVRLDSVEHRQYSDYSCDHINVIIELFRGNISLGRRVFELRYIAEKAVFWRESWHNGGKLQPWMLLPDANAVEEAVEISSANAVSDWLYTAGPRSVLADAPEARTYGPWEAASGDLPAEMGKITFFRKSAHPFLAEYYRKIRLHATGIEPRTLRLPFDTGGGANVRLYLIDMAGERCLRIKDRCSDVVIKLATATFGPSGELPEGRLLGVFMYDEGGLSYVGVSTDRAKLQELLQREARAGHRELQDVLESLER